MNQLPKRLAVRIISSEITLFNSGRIDNLVGPICATHLIIDYPFLYRELSILIDDFPVSAAVFRLGLKGEARQFRSVHARNHRPHWIIGRIDLDFVEREATPELLMKLSIQLHLAGYHFRILFRFLMYSVLIAHVQPFITGFTKPIYSQRRVRVRISSRLMRR